MSGDKYKGKYGTRSSVSRALAQEDDPVNTEAAERGALLKLNSLESLNDPHVS